MCAMNYQDQEKKKIYGETIVKMVWLITDISIKLSFCRKLIYQTLHPILVKTINKKETIVIIIKQNIQLGCYVQQTKGH